VKQTKTTKKRKHLLTLFEMIYNVKDMALLIIGKASRIIVEILQLFKDKSAFLSTELLLNRV